MYILGIIIVITVLCFFLGKRTARNLKRKRLLTSPIPAQWQKILEKNVYLYRRLPSSLKKELHGLMNIFLDEKHFEECGDLKVTGEMKVTIASQACMLLLNRKTKFYPNLFTIFVYPKTFVGGENMMTSDGVLRERRSARLGESWHRGPLVLAWDTVIENARNSRDGHNVVLHEFAHQLDTEDGKADGAPNLGDTSFHLEWARVFKSEYEKLRKNIEQHKRSFLDSYAGTNPAEFFAVVTEAFYTEPKELKRKEPELYEELRKYYQVDPAEWRATSD